MEKELQQLKIVQYVKCYAMVIRLPFCSGMFLPTLKAAVVKVLVVAILAEMLLSIGCCCALGLVTSLSVCCSCALAAATCSLGVRPDLLHMVECGSS
jgi:hypothetical protein